MNNRNQLPRNAEEQIVINRARQDARRGTLAGAGAGGAAGYLIGKKRRIAGAIGAIAGAVAGDHVGRRAGTAAGARDIKSARRALREMEVLHDRLDALEQRDLDRNGNAMEPGLSGQHPVLGYRVQHATTKFPLGQDAEQQSKFTPERERLAALFGHGVVDCLSDDELSEVNCRRLRDAVLSRQAKAAGPHASSNTDPEFERHFLASKLGDKAVSEMPDSLVHCHFLSAQRRGLIEFAGLDSTTDFALVNRSRNDEGEFVDQDQMSSQAVQRAYAKSPRERRTGVSTAVGAAGVAAGLLGVAAHLRGRKSRRPRLPVGVPKLDNAIDVDSTSFAMTSCAGPGSYIIRRATLRGKKPPGVPKLKGGKRVPKPARHDMAFVIHDPDFPLLPMKQPKLSPGGRQRVKPAKNRAEMLKRLRAITALSRRDFGAGSLAAGLADGAIDALAVGGATNPAKKKKLLIDANGNVVNPTYLPTPDTTSTSSFASALERLHQFGIGSSAVPGIARDVAVIGAADLGASQLSDAVNRARERRRRRLMRQQGIEATPAMGGAPTSMSAVLDTLKEFDADASRDRARKRAGELGAAGAGAAAGALAGAYHDQGRPVRSRDLRPGDQVYRRQGPGGLYQHSGVVDVDGNVVHRSRGSSVARSVKPGSFVKGGRGPLRREVHRDDLPRPRAARNASAAAGTRQGKYSLVGENCQHASSRIASKGAPGSRQLRKVVGGAAVGALAGSTIDRFIRGGKRKDK